MQDFAFAARASRPAATSRIPHPAYRQLPPASERPLPLPNSCSERARDCSPSMNEDQAIQDVLRKIERERNIINAANQMRQATNNAQVTSRAEGQIRDARRNMQYFEQTLQDLRRRKMGDDMSNLSISNNGGPPLPPKGPAGGQQGGGYGSQGYGQQGGYGGQGYGNRGAPGIPPPGVPPYAERPADRSPRARPNYSKLGTYG